MKLRLIRKSTKQEHIDHCAGYLVDHDLAWFTEAQEYLDQYWRSHHMETFFNDYQEFLEEVGYTMNWILVGKKTKPHGKLHLVTDNTRKGKSK